MPFAQALRLFSEYIRGNPEDLLTTMAILVQRRGFGMSASHGVSRMQDVAE